MYFYNFQDKTEHKDDAGVVHGYYSAHLPDGCVQKGTYTVDHYSSHVPVVEYVGEAKYPANNYDEEYGASYKGSFKGYHKGGYKSDHYGYQPTKPTNKKPHYWNISINLTLRWLCTLTWV